MSTHKDLQMTDRWRRLVEDMGLDWFIHTKLEDMGLDWFIHTKRLLFSLLFNSHKTSCLSSSPVCQLCIRACVCVCARVCVFVYIFGCVCMRACWCVRVCVCVHVCVCWCVHVRWIWCDCRPKQRSIQGGKETKFALPRESLNFRKSATDYRAILQNMTCKARHSMDLHSTYTEQNVQHFRAKHPHTYI